MMIFNPSSSLILTQPITLLPKTTAVKNRQSKVRVKLLDKNGQPVPESEYDLVLGEEDFAFKLKRQDRSKSGRYRVVVSNDAGEAEKEVDVDFAGKDGHTRVGSIMKPLE